MKLENFNWIFYTVLIVITMSLFTYAWDNHQAIKTIERNANYSVDRETERSFNKWDFERNYKMFLYIAILFFILTISYLILCIRFDNKIKDKTTQEIK